MLGVNPPMDWHPVQGEQKYNESLHDKPAARLGSRIPGDFTFEVKVDLGGSLLPSSCLGCYALPRAITWLLALPLC